MTEKQYESEYNFEEHSFEINDDMKDAYKQNGYILIRNLLSDEEICKVRKTVETSEVIKRHTSGRKDDTDKETEMCVWNHPGDDVLGILVRMQKVAGTMEQLMDVGEIYHYHSKLTMKNPKTGGAFLWHQDYGYWYYNGCLFPDMGSIFLPIDDCLNENGCLQILKGSHKLGRLDHQRVGDQQQADSERVDMAKQVCEHVLVEMKAGDALFFHGNLLHTSGKNISDKRRWALVTGFNAKRNNPFKKHHHAQYTPMTKVDNSELMKCEVYEQEEGKWFMNYQEEENVQSYNNTNK